MIELSTPDIILYVRWRKDEILYRVADMHRTNGRLHGTTKRDDGREGNEGTTDLLATPRG